jgi:hypothetical protein
VSQNPDLIHSNRHRMENPYNQSRSSSPEPMDNNGEDNDHQVHYAHGQRSRSVSRSISRSVSQSPSRSRSPSSPISRNSSPNSSPKRFETMIEDSD